MNSPPIDRETLTAVVQLATQRPRLQVNTWQTEELSGGFGTTTGGLQWLTVVGSDGPDPVEHSIVRKVLSPPAQTNGETDWNYWKREALVLQSRLLEDLPEGVAVPQCYRIDEDSDGAIVLWIEAIPKETELQWSIPRYRLAAQHLGRFNGASLMRPAVPDYSFLSRNWLASWMGHRNFREELRMAQRADLWETSLVQKLFLRPLIEEFARLESDLPRFQEALGRIPTTLCHLDAFRRNLMSRTRPDGKEETVVIDWAFCGRGALGEEAGQLVWASLLIADPMNLEQIEAMENAVLEGYIEGLRDAGWNGNPQDVRLGMDLAGVLRWGFLLPGAVLIANDPERQAAFERFIGVPMEEFLPRWAAIGHHLLQRADRVRRRLDKSL